MADARLLAASLIGAGAAVLWGLIGRAQWRRDRAPEHARAGRAFAAGWFGACGYAASASILAAATGAGAQPQPWWIVAPWISLVSGLVFVWGIVAYLAHLLTGSRRVFAFVSVAYVAQLLALVFLVIAFDPIGAESTGWTSRFAYANPATATNAIIVITILVPAAFASLGYLVLLPRVHGATPRWRIALVGGGLTVWLLGAIAARVPALPSTFVGASRLLGLAAAGAVFFAYAPPAWARRRFGVASLDDEVVRERLGDAARLARAEALAERTRTLI